MTLLRFSPLTRPVAFLDGTESLIGELGRIMCGWDASPAPGDAGEPLFTVRRRFGAYRIEAPWLEAPVSERQTLRAAGNLAVDLAEAYLVENPSSLCLHCAAAMFNGRLVIFPSRARAGKSTLAGRLAAAGVPILTDDLLILTGPDDAEGMSLGITVRLRLPLPATASPDFHGFVTAHRGLSDAQYIYLDLPEAIGPEFGRTAPVGAIMLLDRQPGGAAEIAPTSRGEGLHQILLQNLQLGIGAVAVMARMRRLAEAVPCFTLRYSDLDDASSVLRAHFADWKALPGAIHPGEAPVDTDSERPVMGGETGPRFRARPDAVVQSVDGGCFLTCEENDGVYRLNDVSFGLWNLVQQPTSVAEASAILHGAFPDIAAAQIECDVRAFFADMETRGLIHPA